MQLAAAPQQGARFEKLVADWHGVPGVALLRQRWEAFATERSGFAVLAALLDEADGRPADALRRLQSLRGTTAEWHAARLLALSGREAEAVTAFSALITTADDPHIAAQALLALTELDCIRGNFTAALERTEAAWKNRPEEAFRLFILERHFSLLVQSARDSFFISTLLTAAQAAGGDQAAAAETKYLALISLWLPGDERLQNFRMQHEKAAGARLPAGCGYMSPVRTPIELGTLFLDRTAREQLESSGAISTHTVTAQAWQTAREGKIPAPADAPPWLRAALQTQPMQVCATLAAPLRSGAGRIPATEPLAALMPGGAARLVPPLMIVAHAGKAGPPETEALVRIIAEAPLDRLMIEARSGSGWSVYPGWPTLRDLHSGGVIWNLSGPAWLEYYARASALRILSAHGSSDYYFQKEDRTAPADWRPEWPRDGTEGLTAWAWQQLARLGKATPETASRAASALPAFSDRLRFASLCMQTQLIMDYCRDEALLAQADSGTLRRALDAICRDAQEPSPAHAAAVRAVCRVLGPRFGLQPDDLLLTGLGGMHLMSPAEQQETLSHPAVPESPWFAEVLGKSSSIRTIVAAEAEARHRTIPNPLCELPVCPSVERLRHLQQVAGIQQPQGFGSFERNPVAESVIGMLLGWAGNTSVWPGQPDYLKVLRDFPTSNPIVQTAVHWRELCEQQPDLKKQTRGLPSFPQGVLTVIREMGTGDKAPLEWAIAAAMMEAAPEKKEELLAALRKRSPLCARAGMPAPEAGDPAGMAATPEPARATVPQTLELFRKLIADPEGRTLLLLPGTMYPWLNGSSSSAALAAMQQLQPEEFPELCRLLVQENDPLAARLAVCLAGRSNDPAGKQPALLRESLAKFPDDPELLLARAFCDPEAAPEDARLAFHRALRLLTAMPQDADDGTRTVWCGMNPLRSAEPASAGEIAAAAMKLQPGTLPAAWLSVVSETPLQQSGNTGPGDTLAAAKAMARHGKMLPDSNKRLTSMLKNLADLGRAEDAAALAEQLLLGTSGELATPEAEPRQPWYDPGTAEAISAGSEGWIWLTLAAKFDPSGVADRLRAAAAGHPADEQLNFAALLAAGYAGPLKDTDLEALAGLKPSGRHRALAWASRLLPPGRVPADALPDALAAEAEAEFKVVWNGTRNFMHGISYLDNLEASGASDAALRCLRAAVDAMPRVGGFPDGFLVRFRDRLSREGTPADVREKFHSALRQYAENNKDDFGHPVQVGEVLWLFLFNESSLPDWLVSLTDEALAAAIENEEYHQKPGAAWIFPLMGAAVEDRRWHDQILRLLEKQPELVNDPDAPGWRHLTRLITLAQQKDALPEVSIAVTGREGRDVEIGWDIIGFARIPPAPEQGITHPPGYTHTRLARELGGKFKAEVLVKPLTAAAIPAVVAEIPEFPESGRLKLSNIPSGGYISMHLTRREEPRSRIETMSVYFSDAKTILDSRQTAAAPEVSPPGWKIYGSTALLNPDMAIHVCAVSQRPSPASPLSLLLLDDTGAVCGVESLGQNYPERSRGRRLNLPGRLIAPGEWTPGAGIAARDTPQTEIAPVRRPVRIALAQRLPAQSESVPDHMFVEEWPAPPAEPAYRDENAGPRPDPIILDVAHQWLVDSETDPVLPAPGGTTAALPVGDFVWLVPLSRSAETLRPIEWPLRSGRYVREYFWVGETLWRIVHGTRRSGGATTQISFLESLSAGPPRVAPASTEIEKQIQVTKMGGSRAYAVLAGQAIVGMITEKEGFLRLAEEDAGLAKGGVEFTGASAGPLTVACALPGRDSQFILDWSSGTLRLHEFEGPLLPPDSESSSFLRSTGVPGEYGDGMGGRFRTLCDYAVLIPLGGGRFTAFFRGGVALLEPRAEK